MHPFYSQYLQNLQSPLPDLQSPLDRPLTITRFPDQWAKTKRQLTMTMREFAGLIEETEAATKEALPYFKQATFGKEKTAKGCWRHDANVVSISGVQGDYDGGTITPEEAEQCLRDADVAALICTTPSHGKPGKGQRWRVWCPCDDDLSPDQYFALVARLNGALGGVLAGESFTLSQSFFAGRVTGGRAVQTILVEGRAINLCDDLDAGAMGKPTRRATDSGADGGLDVDRAMQDVRSGAVIHTNLNSLAARWFSEGMPYSDVKKELVKLLDEEFEGVKDARWRQRISGVDSILENIYGKEIAAQFKDQKHKDELLDDMMDADELAKIDALLGIEMAAEIGDEFGSPMMNGNKPIINQTNADYYLARNRDSIIPGLRHNLMTHRDEWAKGDVKNTTVTRVRKGLERAAFGTVPKELVVASIQSVGMSRSYHPIKDWLLTQNDTGRGLLDTWLMRYAGAEDTPYIRAIGRMFLIQMVARIMQPGCKADYMPILFGPQGQMKSSLCRALAGDAYFSDSLPPVTSAEPKEAMAHLQGLWLVEVAEMASMRDAAQETLKAFISRQSDRFRSPYAPLDEVHHRQCVMIGTTNKEQFLRDETGGRRFWPVTCHGLCDPEAMVRDRGQLFAEALAAYRAGEQWWPDREFERDHMAPMQEAAFVQDPWGEAIREWLEKPEEDTNGAKTRRRQTTVRQVADECLDMPDNRMTRATDMRIAALLKRMGWVKVKSDGQRVWRPLKGAHLEVVK